MNQPPPRKIQSSFTWRVVNFALFGFISLASLFLIALSAAISYGGCYAWSYLWGDWRLATALGVAAIAFFAAILTVPVGSAIMSLFVTHEYEGKTNPVAATFGAIFLPLLSALLNWFPLFPVWLAAPIACGLMGYNMPSASAAFWSAIVAPGAGIAAGVLVIADVFGDFNV